MFFLRDQINKESESSEKAVFVQASTVAMTKRGRLGKYIYLRLFSDKLLILSIIIQCYIGFGFRMIVKKRPCFVLSASAFDKLHKSTLVLIILAIMLNYTK